jgi:hypothetical protein
MFLKRNGLFRLFFFREEIVLLSVWCRRTSELCSIEKRKRPEALDHCRPGHDPMTPLRRCPPVLLPACWTACQWMLQKPYERFPFPDWVFSLTDRRVGLSRGAVVEVLRIHSPMGTFWSAILRSTYLSTNTVLCCYIVLVLIKLQNLGLGSSMCCTSLAKYWKKIGVLYRGKC